MILFNFCFRNSNGQWDNNDGQNYVFQLEKPQTELIVLEDEPSSIGAPRKLRKSYLWSKKKFVWLFIRLLLIFQN